MAIRGLGDVFALQRLVWLLIGTVIVPTVLLAAYGVMAIRSERAATWERLRTQQQTRLIWSASNTYDEIARMDVAVHAAVSRCDSAAVPSCELNVEGVEEVWVFASAGPRPKALRPYDLPAPASAATEWVTPPTTNPLGLYTDDEQTIVWRPDTEYLANVVSHLDRPYPEDPPIRLEHRGVLGDASPDDLMTLAGDYRVALVLESPLNQYVLLVDLTELQSSTLAWLYSLGLAALVLLVMLGSVFTTSAAAREIRLSRLQTDFVSHLGHELRTPMTSIRMFVETLHSGRLKDPERIKECLDLLAQETDRLTGLIERVLEWGRMEAGRRVYEFEDLSADEVIRSALAAFESHTLLDDSQTRVAVFIPEGLPRMRIDGDAVAEALLNLLQNAYKYTPAPREINIEARLKKNRKYVGLSVADNGPGIARHERRRIFEKFYQADSLLSREIQGSGLGLAIVRAVVNGHKGKVQLESELDAGSTFTLWLPVAR